MKQKDIVTTLELLKSSKKIVITSHLNPDGDAVGSSLGLYHILQQLNYDCTVVLPNNYPSFLKWTPGNEKIILFEKQQKLASQHISEADVIFTLDFNDLSRTGIMESALQTCKAKYIMIDHHQQPKDYAQITYSDGSMGSTCEMVYHFIEYMGYSHLLNKAIADCLYVGIVTDTGSFRFPNTTSITHKVVAHLIDLGVDNAKIYDYVYNNNSTSRLSLLKTSLNNMVVLDDYQTVYTSLSKQEIENVDFKKGDTEGFVNYGLSLQNINFSVIFIEDTQEDYIKISFRSYGNFSVNQFARNHFEGGGHKNAAGGRSDLNMKDTITKFVSLLPKYQKEL